MNVAASVAPTSASPGSGDAAHGLLSLADLARLDRLALSARARRHGGEPGDRRARRVGAGGEFVDHRAYVPGDDLRYVDWNVYERLGDLVVKRFEATDAVRVLLVVDRSASMDGRKGREARRIAAALAHVALRRRDAVDVAFVPGVEGRPVVERVRDPAALAQLFAALRSVPDAGPTELERELTRVAAATRRRGPAVLLSDFFDPAGAAAGLSRLRARGLAATAIHLLDPADAELPVGEALRCIDRETGETLDVDVTPDLAEAVRTAWRRRAERVSRWCAEREIGWVPVEAGRSLWDVLADCRRAGVVVGA